MRYFLPLVLLMLFVAGCGEPPLTLKDAEQYGDDCKLVGEHEFECSYTDARGQVCIVSVSSDYDNDTDSSCQETEPKLDCNNGSDNTSGNVCIVTKKDGTQCVAVLPDGESNRKQDNIDCGEDAAKEDSDGK